MRTAILVDALINRGGVERIVLAQAQALDADIYVARFNPDKTFSEFKSLRVHTILYSPAQYGTLVGKLTTLKTWHAFSKMNLNHDLYIIHGAGSLNAAKKNGPNIWYYHSPSRYLYDLYEEIKAEQKGWRKLMFPLVTSIMRKKDQKIVKHVDRILVNSENVQRRVKRFYGRESHVLYPFVDIDKFKFIRQEDFYLSACRLDPIKRVDLVIEAFKQLPDKKLVIASDGPDRKRLEKLAKGYDNITFLGYISEEKLHELYGSCIASIYLSHKEDFGLVPVESNAAGKPCIATNAGGFKETIIHKKTGYLVYDPTDTEQVT